MEPKKKIIKLPPPQFKGESVLFIAAGKQDAKIYLFKDSEMWELDSFKVDKPRYSDREGHFESSGRGGKYFVSGSVYEAKDEVTVRNFLKELNLRLKKIKNKYSKAVLFAPDYVLNTIKKALPKDVREKIEITKSGNYFKKRPQELLDLIKNKA